MVRKLTRAETEEYEFDDEMERDFDKQLERPSSSYDLSDNDSSICLRKQWNSYHSFRSWNKVIIPKENGRYRLWMNVILLWAAYSSFFTPIEFGFFRGLPAHLWWIDQIGQIMFMVDIAVNFFVAYRDLHTYKWVTNHRSIAIRYAKSSLIPDILGCLPWDAIYRRSGSKEIVRYFLWIRLYRVRKVDAFFHRMEKNIRINYLFTRIVKLIAVELYCTHTAACIFYYLATTMPSSKEDLTWIGSLTLGGYSFHNFREIDLGRRYVVSLYFAVITMATVGYGDIHAVNTREMIFVMIFVSFDMILGAYLVGNMTALIVKGSNTEKFRDKMTSLMKYMNRNKLKKDIRSELKNHLRLQYELQFVENSVVQDLPFSIRAKVSQSLYTSTVERALLFRNCSAEFINQIGMRVREEFFLPGEIVIEQGNAIDQIYIVSYGSLVEVFVNIDGSEEFISKLEAESMFGEVAVLCRIPQPYTVRVVDLCKVLRIDKQSILNIMHIYFADGRQVLDNLLKFSKDAKLNKLESDIVFMISEQEVELSLKVNNAAYQGKTSHLKSLIKSGADPNRADYDGRTPMHLAALRGHEDIVQFLLQKGAEVDVEDRFGNTPLLEAVKGCHTTVIKILRTVGGHLTGKHAGCLLHQAVLAGNSEVVRALLDNGIDPNYSDHNGQTALHIAASEGLVMIVQILLEYGADIHAIDRWGKTPVQEGIQFGSNVLKNIMMDAVMQTSKRLETPELQNVEGYEKSTADEKQELEICKSFLVNNEQMKRRCTIFPHPPCTAPGDGKRGVVSWVPDTVSELLDFASKYFGYKYNFVLNENGGEIICTDHIRDSERVYVLYE